MEAEAQKQIAAMEQQMGGEITQENMQKMQEQKKRQNAQKDALIRQILTPEAHERLSRVRLVKPDTADAVEAELIGKAQSGALGGKVNEAKLKELLSSGIGGTKVKVTIQRRKQCFFDDELDDDNDDDLL